MDPVVWHGLTLGHRSSSDGDDMGEVVVTENRRKIHDLRPKHKRSMRRPAIAVMQYMVIMTDSDGHYEKPTASALSRNWQA